MQVLVPLFDRTLKTITKTVFMTDHCRPTVIILRSTVQWRLYFDSYKSALSPRAPSGLQIEFDKKKKKKEVYFSSDELFNS